MAAQATTTSVGKKKEAEKVRKRKMRRRAWFDMARALLIGQKKS